MHCFFINIAITLYIYIYIYMCVCVCVCLNSVYKEWAVAARYEAPLKLYLRYAISLLHTEEFSDIPKLLCKTPFCKTATQLLSAKSFKRRDEWFSLYCHTTNIHHKYCGTTSNGRHLFQSQPIKHISLLAKMCSKRQRLGRKIVFCNWKLSLFNAVIVSYICCSLRRNK